MGKVLFLSFLQASVLALGYQDFDQYQRKWTKSEIERRLQFLVKHRELLDHFVLTDDRLEVYASPARKNLEYTYHFAPTAQNHAPAPRSWRQLRVAISPGHIGGSFGRLEGRYVEMEHDPSITFQEGDLVLHTAWALEDMLKAQGATTLLLKEEIGHSSFGMTYEEFVADAAKQGEALKAVARSASEHSWWLANLPKLYRRYDMAVRKKASQDFLPDMTVSIHYNAYYPDKKKVTVDGQTFLRDRIGLGDYHMAFVPGGYMRGELKHRDQRRHFVYWLVSGRFEDSARLAYHFMEELAAVTGVDPIQSFDDLDYFNDYRTPDQVANNYQANYLKRATVALDHPTLGFYGVSARNLYNSGFRGAVIIGESFCQESNYQRLFAKDARVRGVPTSSLVLQVAKAYFQAVDRWRRD